jgi:metal-responsive CopG/Arc/MetJ family transcriptional regulator
MFHMYLRSEKRGKQERKVRVEFGAVSVPIPILEEIDKLIEELGYWPSRSSFVREACLEKIQYERERLKRLRGS